MSECRVMRKVQRSILSKSARSLLCAASGGLALPGLVSDASAQQSLRLNEIQVSAENPGGVAPAAVSVIDHGDGPVPSLSGEPILASREAARGPIDGYVARTSASATKTATPISETPQAISVIGAKQIQDQDIETLDQALNYTPGVRGQANGFDYRNDWFILRGFRAHEAGIYLDGLQLYGFGFSTFQLEPWGLQRIEVLRGPTASLYGGGNPGGIINGVSKLPTFTNFGVVELSVNEFGNAVGAFDFGGVAGERGEWSYRLAGLGRAGGTQVDFTDFNRAFIAPSLTYRPDGGTSLTFLGHYNYTSTASQNFLPYQGTVIPASFGRISNRFFASDPNFDRFKRNQALIGYQFEHAIDSDTIFRQNFRFSTSDIYGRGLFSLGYATPPTATQGLLSRGKSFAHDAAFLTNVDNNLEHRFETGPFAHVALVGLDYKHYGQNQNQGFEIVAPPIDVLNPVYAPVAPIQARSTVRRNTFDQLGLYAQDQIKFDQLTILLGIRYDLLQQNLNNKLPGSADFYKETGKFSGRVGAIYNTDWGIGPYVSYSTSFNPLIINTSASVLARPETGEQYEVGIKYAAPSVPIAASVALFDLTRANVPVPDPSLVFFQVQSGEQNSRGIEAEVTATLAEGFSLIGAYTAYDLRITKNTIAANIGRAPAGIPEVFASLWATYTIPKGEYRGLGIGAGLRYVGSSFANADNTLTTPEIFVGDLSVHYDTGSWRAALNFTNFTDEKYVSSCTSINACYYAERRRTTVSLAYRW